ncbi:MAG: methylenetetrahydrofolate reductase [NAD(P)H] [Burkholderiaceae bacterium]
MSDLQTVSFEFFPPRTPEGVEKLRGVRHELATFSPEFYSVTFGAGGSTREGTLATITEMHAGAVAAAPHLSCVGATQSEMRETLLLYRDLGVRRMVALRGDLPSGTGALARGDFHFARDLVAFVRSETGDWFHIEVAAYPEIHPQAKSPEADLANLVAKFDAGADSAITQYFYNADAYFRLVDDATARGVTAPIVPGIMPITNYTQLARFSDGCGAEIPRWIRLKLAAFGDDTASIKAFGMDVVTDLCARLLAGGAQSLHFYTLNQAGPSTAICKRLGR